ncbi:MAG TPA: hypothetical protein VMW49_02885 [Candidatus Dormibacteraeota bacterium]|nr:hypothetical protein [Candidatus Dormibacteraeota bacterium]
MASRRELACPNRCPEGRFEVLGAPVFVDRTGTYTGHDDRRATFRCVTCQAVALDLRAVAAAMRRESRHSPGEGLRCPGCGSWLLAPEADPLAPLLECPSCGVRFEADEARPELLGRSSPADREEDRAWDDLGGDDQPPPP